MARTDAPYDIYDYQVLDANGRRLGPLTGFWVDDATNQPEFASVKTGWIAGRNHVVPLRGAQLDHGRRVVQLQHEERVVRDAPVVQPDEALSGEEERRIYEHYGLSRGMEASPTGLPEGVGEAGGAFGRREGEEPREVAEIPLREERVEVGKREADAGEVRLRKVVRSEVQEIPVELRRERVDVERVPASELRGGPGARAGEAFREEEFTMTERREEPAVERTSEVVGGVRAEKRVETERQDVRAETRREDVEVDRDERGPNR